VLSVFSLPVRFLSNLVLRCCVLLALGLGLGLGLGLVSQAHAAQVFNFNGNAVNVSGCKLAGTAYTCDTLPKRQDDDRMVIASGYAVHIKADVVPGWAYGLTMSGTARLTSDGNINLTQMAPGNASITGGAFDAGGTFSAGPPARIVANVSAGALALGTGPEFHITGKLVSRGAVTLAYATTVNGSVSGASVTTNSQATITGAIISTGPVYIGYKSTVGGAVTGTAITTDAEVTFKSDVTATTRFILASRGTVTGNVKAPEVALRSEGTVVTGKVAASASLVLGSGVTVNGDVDTGKLTLEASNATVNGNASVDFAYLQYAGRVSQKIYCKNGTRANACDCVDNQSGWPVNSVNGPTCETAKPPPGALHHFLITHDGSGRTCAPETVTVTACADQACSSTFKGGAQVTLMPDKIALDTGDSGVASASVARTTADQVTLALSQGNSSPTTTCRNSATNGASCILGFERGMSFTVTAADHRAGVTIDATIKAVDVDPVTGTCVAALKGQTKKVNYSCSHDTPTNEKMPLNLGGTALACATGAQSAIDTSFGNDGVATLTLNYQDVGKLKLMASLGDAEGDGSFIVGPYTFDFPVGSRPAAPIRAGDKFKIGVRALTMDGKVTPSFDKNLLGADGFTTAFAASCVAKGSAGQVTADKAEFVNGSATASMSWSEVGKVNLEASLTGFLGSATLGKTVNVVGNSAPTPPSGGCDADVGPFIPKYFQVDQPLEPAPRSWFYYAGEPVPVRVRAMNTQGGETTNYTQALGLSEAVTLTVFDDKASTANPGGGKLENAAIASTAFVNGVAFAKPAYSPAAAAPIAVDKLRFRATNGKAVNDLVTSAEAADHEAARPGVKSGRLRIGNAFGRVNVQLDMPIWADYWTGKSWLVNEYDSDTVLPKGGFTQKAVGKGGGVAPATIPIGADLKLANGKTVLKVKGDRTGWIDLAFNLGAITAAQPCGAGSYPSSTGANMPWLRRQSTCPDPSARATFGELAPESRRLIHVREVFN